MVRNMNRAHIFSVLRCRLFGLLAKPLSACNPARLKRIAFNLNRKTL